MLYSIVAELLADNIEHHCPHTMVRSYADDTAIVSEDIWQEGPVLARLFAEFQKISGLALNLRKCSFIPLYIDNHDNIQQQLQRIIPTWQHMEVTNKSKYLGFYIGPGKGANS